MPAAHRPDNDFNCVSAHDERCGGRFTLNIVSIDSALVAAYEDVEDEANYDTSRMVGGRANATFCLDMSRSVCHY